MTEPAERLRMLVEHPATLPEPVAELRRRVDARRRRRATRQAAVAGLVVVAMSIVVVPLLGSDGTGPARIATAPGPAPGVTTGATPDATEALVFVPGVPVDTRLQYSVPHGWQTLFGDGQRMVVSTRPMSEGDRELAKLARSDAVFAALVPDAVVVVVGGDPTEAKYGFRFDGTPIDPGPPFALGPEQLLPGGVRFRRGEIPKSTVRIASYAGPTAPADRLREAEAVVASIRQVRIGDPSVPSPPPPAGSTIGLPSGPLPVAEQGLPEVVRAGPGSPTLVVMAGIDCAYMRYTGSQPDVQAPVAGGCGTRPSESGIAVVGWTAQLRDGPGTAVIMRAGRDVATVAARTSDGRLFAAVLGVDGWGIAVGTGRIVLLIALDANGRQVSEAFVR